MSDVIFTHPNFVIKEDTISLEDSTDVAVTVTLETDKEEFEWSFVYNTLISFTRCKK